MNIQEEILNYLEIAVNNKNINEVSKILNKYHLSNWKFKYFIEVVDLIERESTAGYIEIFKPLDLIKIELRERGIK